MGPARVHLLGIALRGFCLVFAALSGWVTPARAVAPCDVDYVFDNGSVRSTLESPVCFAKLHRELRRLKRPRADFLVAALVVADDRLAATAWKDGRPLEARRYWKQSATDSVAVDTNPPLSGIADFTAGRYAQSFRWFACYYRSADACPYSVGMDAALASWGVYDYVMRGLDFAARGRYPAAVKELREAAHRPIPSSVGGNPESFLLLGMVEVSCGERAAGIGHLIDASKRTGGSSPESPPSTFLASQAVDVLLHITEPGATGA